MGNRMGSWLTLDVQTSPPAAPPTGRTLLAAWGGHLYAHTPDGRQHALTRAGAQLRRAVVDFGSTPTQYGRWQVSDPLIAATSLVMIDQSGVAAPGRPFDEAEMDPIEFRARPEAGSMVVIAKALEGPVVGAYVIDYVIG